jgi:hypothetical protein
MLSTFEKAMTAREVMDGYFLETRGKLLEIGAMLDRVDRGAELLELRGDVRLVFIFEALKILQSAAPNRAELIQRLYSKGSG